MNLLDYKCQTAFWEDFSIAEMFGEEAVRDTYKRAKAEWKNDRIYGTELSIVLNHKCHYWYEERNTKLSRLCAELWEEWHGWVLENWEGEDLGYYLRIMD